MFIYSEARTHTHKHTHTENSELLSDEAARRDLKSEENNTIKNQTSGGVDECQCRAGKL